jgi:uncharacterized cupredoxin-like copper-binding protein
MRKLLLLIPLALVLSACGGTSGGTNSPNQGHLGEVAGLKGTTLTLILKDFTITPQNVTLPKTGAYTIVIWNEGSQLHSLKIEGNGLSAKAKEINFGEKASLKVTFPKSGKYTMYCPVPGHRALGMTGTITVG